MPKSKPKTRSSTKKLPKFCAPFVNPNKTITNRRIKSCLSRPALLRLVKTWNTQNRTDTIKPTGNNEILWNALNSRMKSACGNGREFCWISQKPLSTVESTNELDVFKPVMPAKWYEKPNEWLNSLDIQAIMEQYERAYDRFRFIGPVPMDFDKKLGFGGCVVNELCNIDVVKLHKSGIRQIGIIFNLDPHDKPGSHWVALFCCLEKCGIYYWDSYGYEPSKEIQNLMARLKANCETKMGWKMAIELNDVRHQYKGSECGVYCLHFIIQLLKGKSFKSIVRNVIPDDEMLEYRKELYNMVRPSERKRS